ncbi:MAG: hypothetical protein ACO2ZZ_03865 [Cyclobacteriaceae bacterium]
MRNTVHYIFFFFFGLIACEEAFEFKSYEDPVVTYQFIDADSIYQLQLINNKSEDSILLLKQLQISLDSSLIAITDSITAIEIAIDSGNNSFNNIRSELSVRYTNDSIYLLNIKILITDYQLSMDSIASIQSGLNEGFILLDFVAPQFGVSYIETFTDSMNAYVLPLNTTDTISRYIIGISSKEYSLSLTHENKEFITADLGVKIGIDQLMVYHSNFDSVSLS